MLNDNVLTTTIIKYSSIDVPCSSIEKYPAYLFGRQAKIED
jgi:hypothetical protein